MSNDVKEFLRRMASEAPVRSGIPPRLPRRVRRRRVLTVAASVTAVAVAAYGGTIAVRALQRPSVVVPATPAACSWTTEPSPSLNQEDAGNRLLAAAAPAPEELWAFGDVVEELEGGFQSAIAIHKDPTGVSFEGIPDRQGLESLNGATAAARDDVWAVGFTGNAGLALRWDGRQLSEVPLEDPGLSSWHLSDVHAITADDIWAVGGQAEGGYGAPLVERWDGERWYVAPAPLVPVPPLQGPSGFISTLEAISATSAEDVWAVGESTQVAPVDRSTELLAHWDGERWTIEAVFETELRDRSVHLFGVEAVSPTDVWAVGISGSDPGYGGGGDQALVLHRDPAGWTVSELPSLPEDSRLFGVVARSPTEVYAVGSSGVSGSYEPLVLRWNGGGWAQEALPIGEASLSDVTVDPAGTVWTVGYRENGESLVMRCGAGD